MSALVDAWQAALAAEQQAAFGYALLGPHVPAGDQDRARSCQSAHETLRDGTADTIASNGATPVAPQGDYPALYAQLRTPRALAATLEDDCTAAWRYLYGVAAGTSPATAATRAARTAAQRAMTAGAVRATRWRLLIGSTRAVTPFPGS